MFWPPRLPKLPPTKAMCAVPHQAPSSPTVSTSRMGAPATPLASRLAASRSSNALTASGAARAVRCVEQLGDGVEAFGMARDEDKPQPRVLRRQAAEDVDGDLLFRLLRAAGEEDDVVVGDAGQLAQSGGARIVAVGLGAVVFERAGDVHAVGRRAERAKPLGRLLVLGGDEIDLPQHAADERADAAVAAGSCGRSAGR